MVKKRGKAGHSSNTIKKGLLEALELTLGVVTTACKKCNVSRKTYYQYLKEDDVFKSEVDDIQNIALDFAESKLHKAISEDNMTGIIFYLKTKGRGRGYSEHIQVNQTTTHKGIIEVPAVASVADWEKMGKESQERIKRAHEKLDGDE